jgi:hypothetical protein
MKLRRIMIFSWAAILVLSPESRAGMGYTPEQVVAQYGSNVLARVTAGDYAQADVLTNCVLITGHRWSNQIQVTVGYLAAGDGIPVAGVLKYSGLGTNRLSSAWVQRIADVNASGHGWLTNGAFARSGQRQELWRDDQGAWLRHYPAAGEARVTSSVYELLVKQAREREVRFHVNRILREQAEVRATSTPVRVIAPRTP